MSKNLQKANVNLNLTVLLIMYAYHSALW